MLENNFDAATCLIERREGIIMVRVGSSESAVEEAGIAQIVRNSFNEVPLNWDNDKLINLCMKYRVIPKWVANHREALSKLVGLSLSENQEYQANSLGGTCWELYY